MCDTSTTIQKELQMQAQTQTDVTDGANEKKSHHDEPSVDDNVAKKAKKNTYDVWRYFTRIGKQDGKEKATCNGCGKAFAVGGKQYGTSTLWRHVESCRLIPKFRDIGTMMLDQAGKVRSRHFDSTRFREIVAKTIVLHDFPYSYVEYEGVREICEFLNPDCKFISRKTAVVDVWNLYLKQKEIVKKSIANSPGRICLTTDCWTAITGEGYICMTGHFVDDKWSLNSKILAFTHLQPPHSGSVLANKLNKIVEDWGIEKKVFSIIVDSAAANDNMQNILKDMLNLNEPLICNGEFFHVRCCAHILNLIVQEGLKVVSVAVQKIRESIRYVRASEARAINFKKYVDQVGIKTSMGLRHDVATRWNSTHAMLESAIIYQRAFAKLAIHDDNFPHALTNEEWSRAKEICSFLAPFTAITELMSGSSYPTSNMYFLQISKIELLLKEYVHTDDLVLREMAHRMLAKFDKYWSDYSVILAIAIILDPRMKFDIIRFSYSQLDPIHHNEKIEYIRNKLYCVFDEYKKKSLHLGSSSTSIHSSSSSASGTGSASSASSTTVTEDVPLVRPPLHPSAGARKYSYLNTTAFGSKDTQSLEKSELDFYLEEATLDPNLFIEMNVLEYWKNNSPRFPCLSKMAADILSIPITTVASESAFSIGSRVLTKYRSCLLSDNVEALICTRNWMLGFPSDDTGSGTSGDGIGNIITNVV